MLNEVNPDFLAIRITDLSNGQILQKICIAKGIKVLMLGFTRFGNRGYISHEYDYLDATKKGIHEEEKSFVELREHIQEITSLQSSFRKEFRKFTEKMD